MIRMIGIILWIVVTSLLIVSLWRHHSNDSIIKKAFWSLVLIVPIIGWVFYGGFYAPPEPGPTKSGPGDSGVEAHNGT